MYDLFRETPQAMENSLRIAESCDLEIPMGEYHLPTFPISGENVNVDGDAYLRKLCEKGMKDRYGSDIKPYRDVKKLMADENVNVVDICSYPYQHARQAVVAAEAGKHLIIEKPLALTLKDVYAMQKAAKKSGVKRVK